MPRRNAGFDRHSRTLIGLRFVLPTAAQRFVKRNHGQELIALGAGQVELRGEKLLLSLQNLVIIGLASHIPLRGELHRRLQGGYFAPLMLANFIELPTREQRV